MSAEERNRLLKDVPDDLRRPAGALLSDLDNWLEVFARHYGIRDEAGMAVLGGYHRALMDQWHGMIEAAPKGADGKIDTDNPETHRMMLAMEAAARTGAVFVQRLRYDLGLVPKNDPETVAARQGAAIEKLNEQARALAIKQGKDGSVPPHVQLVCSPHAATALVSGVLMLLRHPGVQGLEVAGVCRSFVEGLRKTFVDAGMTAIEDIIATQVEEFGSVTDLMEAQQKNIARKVERMLRVVDLLESDPEGSMWLVRNETLSEHGLADVLTDEGYPIERPAAPWTDVLGDQQAAKLKEQVRDGD